MMILVPFKPVVLMLGLLSGLVFAGFIGSSLLEGKARRYWYGILLYDRAARLT